MTGEDEKPSEEGAGDSDSEENVSLLLKKVCGRCSATTPRAIDVLAQVLERTNAIVKEQVKVRGLLSSDQ